MICLVKLAIIKLLIKSVVFIVLSFNVIPANYRKFTAKLSRDLRRNIRSDRRVISIICYFNILIFFYIFICFIPIWKISKVTVTCSLALPGFLRFPTLSVNPRNVQSCFNYNDSTNIQHPFLKCKLFLHYFLHYFLSFLKKVSSQLIIKSLELKKFLK